MALRLPVLPYMSFALPITLSDDKGLAPEGIGMDVREFCVE
jgi:hypothetical protein